MGASFYLFLDAPAQSFLGATFVLLFMLVGVAEPVH
jgi:hypothetical protein